MYYNKTKIIATIGPACDSVETLRQMIEAGVDVIRFNLKHNTLAWHEEKINTTKALIAQMGVNVGILADMQGPEIRIRTKEDTGMEVLKGDKIYIGRQQHPTEKSITLVPEVAFDELGVGDNISVDNGNIGLSIVAEDNGYLVAECDRDYLMKNRKALNAPGKCANLPLFSQNDYDAFAMVAKTNPDFVGLSFVRTANDVEETRKELAKINSDAKIMVKIENLQGVQNIEEIVDATDMVIVARGDLGIEVPIEELAYWQKQIVRICREKNKTVIVATQMLLSMVDSYNPTRAEAVDVANAVFDGTDCLWLSDETTIGKYPVRVVEKMASIAKFSEEHSFLKRELNKSPVTTTEILVDAAAGIVEKTKENPIKAAIVFTQSGETARMLSTYRLNVPIIAITDDDRVAKELSPSYSIIPHVATFNEGMFDINSQFFKDLTNSENLNSGDRVLIIHGNEWIKSGETSDISVVTL